MLSVIMLPFLLLSTVESMDHRDVSSPIPVEEHNSNLITNGDNQKRSRNRNRDCIIRPDSVAAQCNGSSSKYDNYLGMPPCFCDEKCHLFGDCCIDKATSRNTGYDQGSKMSSFFSSLTCVKMPIRGDVRSNRVYANQRCNANWLQFNQIPYETLGLIKNLCEMEINSNFFVSFLTIIPAFSLNSGILYRNIYCAACNYDHTNLDIMKPTFLCDYKSPIEFLSNYLVEKNFNPTELMWEFVYNSTKVRCLPRIPYLENPINLERLNTRYCIEIIDKCQSNLTKAGSENATRQCELSRYMYMLELDHKIYKNFCCADCNGYSEEDIIDKSCWKENKPKNEPENSSADLDELGFEVSSEVVDEPEHEINPKNLTEFVLVKLIEGIDLTMLFEPLCDHEHIYDPITKKCKPLTYHVRCLPTFALNLRKGRCYSHQFTNKTDCMRILINETDYSIDDSGQARLHGTNLTLDNNSYHNFSNLDNQTGILSKGILVCHDKDPRWIFPFLFDRVQSFLSIVTLATSILGLTAYMIIFSITPQLRNLRTLMMMNLSAAILLASISFIVGALSRPYLSLDIISNEKGSMLCRISAVSIHYFYLASFAWMNVMAYDLWKSFTKVPGRLSNSSGHFMRYSLYSWLLPAIIVLISYLLDQYNINQEYKPLYGHRVCWISQKKALLMFFVIPVSIIIGINFCFFGITTHVLIQIRSQTRSILKSNSVEDNSRNFVLYLRLAIIMGLTWMVGILATLTSLSVLWYPFIILNGLQGAFIFIVFACKDNVLRHLRLPNGQFRRICQAPITMVHTRFPSPLK